MHVIILFCEVYKISSLSNVQVSYFVHVIGSMYIIHFYCLTIEAGFYSDVVECLPVDPATWVQFLSRIG